MPWLRDAKLKEIGMYIQVQMIEVVELYSLALLTHVLGWDTVRAQILIAGAYQDLRNHDYHMYLKW